MNQIIETVYPLLCPQIPFVDRNGLMSSFLEMNPALWYDEEHSEWICLVRGVNYRKFKNNSFTLYHHPAHSVYWIGRGPSLEALVFDELKYDYGSLQQYTSYWNGVEDIRFIDKTTVLACVPQLHKGTPTMFQATLDIEQKKLHSFLLLSPHESPEKNWMPFTIVHGKEPIQFPNKLETPMPMISSNQTKVIYSCSPFIIKCLETDSKQQIPLTNIQEDILKGYHGSTNGIFYNDMYIFLIHKTIEGRVYNRWLFLYLNNDTYTIDYSDPFTFFTNSYIEFPCSLVLKDNYIYVSLGVNDDKAFVLKMKIHTILI